MVAKSGVFMVLDLDLFDVFAELGFNLHFGKSCSASILEQNLELFGEFQCIGQHLGF